MATKQQRAREDEAQATAAISLATSGSPHYWRAGAALSISSCRIPRGAIIPAELIQGITPDRLDLMLRNRLIVCVMGEPPKAADERVMARFVDAPDPNADAKERERMIAACKARGDPEWTWNAHAVRPPGAYTNTQVPAIERSLSDGSLASVRDIVNGT
jgi:hypothetical protein